MKHSILILSLCVLVGMLASVPAGAQCSIQTFDGTTWAFQTTDDAADSAIGYFTMRVVPTPGAPGGFGGQLLITESVNNHGNISVDQKVTGRYTVDSSPAGPPCTGVLYFMGTNNAFQYRFYVDQFGNRMFLLTENPGVNNNTGFGQFLADHGTARALPGVPSCPLQFPVSGVWTFLTHDLVDGGVGTITFTPTSPTGGILSVTETAVEALFGRGGGLVGIQPNVQLTRPGTYSISPDCSGGILRFDAGNQVNSYAFVFAEFDQFYMLSISGSGGGLMFGNSGFAVR